MYYVNIQHLLTSRDKTRQQKTSMASLIHTVRIQCQFDNNDNAKPMTKHKTRNLCYHKDDRVMCPIYECLRFFGKYPAMDICPLLPECHDLEVNFDWSRNF